MICTRTSSFGWAWIAQLALGSLAACAATPEPQGLVEIGKGRVVTPPVATSATSTTIAQSPRPGRAGWFLLRAPMEAEAAMVRPDLCVAVYEGRQWLISPDTSVATRLRHVPSVCDGTAKQGTAGWPNRLGFSVLPLKERLFYYDYDEYFVGASLDAEPQLLGSPVRYNDMVVAAGDSVLMLGTPEPGKKKKALVRLDGGRWVPVKLDSGEVTSVVGSTDGRVYAVTTKNKLYESADAGATWTPVTIEEKGLELGMLSLYPEYERARTGTVRLAVKRVGDNESLELRLARDVPLASTQARFVPSQPDGVTTVDGAPADLDAQARERLTDGRVCGQVAVNGSSAVASCIDQDMSEIVLWHTDDGGVSVREIARFRPSRQLAELAMTDSKVLMVFGCGASKTDDCRSEHVRVLERKELDVWRERRVEIPGQSSVSRPVLDRAGGFYLQGTALGSTAAQPETTLVHLTDQRADVVPLSSRLRREAPDQPLTVGPMTVHDDGTLGFLVVEGPMSRGDSELSYQHLSRDGALLEKRKFESITLGNVRFNSFALVGRTIVALLAEEHALLVSDDAAATFSVHNPLALRAFSVSPPSYYDEGTRIACGSAGCDLSNDREATRLAWRWGSEPLHATLSEARSGVQDK